MPASAIAGMPSAPVIERAGRHVRLSNACARSFTIGCVPSANGYLSMTIAPSTSAARCACSARSAGIGAWNASGSTRPVAESSMRSSSARAMRNDDGTTPLASPECTPSVSTSTRSGPADEPAKRRRRPQPLVVAAPRVEPDDQLDLSHARRQRVEVGRKVVASRLLAGLDHSDAARMRDALRLQRADRRQRGENRVAVVGAAAAVELAVFVEGIPRAVALAPADHFRLLVQCP